MMKLKSFPPGNHSLPLSVPEATPGERPGKSDNHLKVPQLRHFSPPGPSQPGRTKPLWTSFNNTRIFHIDIHFEFQFHVLIILFPPFLKIKPAGSGFYKMSESDRIDFRFLELLK